MVDIVERLRTFGAWAEVSHRHNLVNEAADEIERLREEIRHIMEDYTIKRKV